MNDIITIKKITVNENDMNMYDDIEDEVKEIINSIIDDVIEKMTNDT